MDDPEFLFYERCKFGFNMITQLGLGVVKTSILLFYELIFSVRSFRVVANVLIGIVAVWTIAFFLTNLFTCWPVTNMPEFSINCMDALSMWYAMAVSDILVDLVIFAMPIPMVLKLHLPLKQRIAILGIFFVGATVCAVSITRAWVFFYVGKQLLTMYGDSTYIMTPTMLWTTIELSLAIVIACLPTYGPILLFFKERQQKKSSSSATMLGSYPKSVKSTFQSSKGQKLSNGSFDDGDNLFSVAPKVESTIEQGATE